MRRVMTTRTSMTLIYMLLGAAWGVYGILGGGKVFLAVMVAATLVAAACAAVLRRQLPS